MDFSGFALGYSYVIQNTANLVPPAWSGETNSVAADAVAPLTNFTANCAEKFYRPVEYY